MLALIEDKARECDEYGIPSSTFFLDMRQQTLVDNLCRQLRVKYFFDGGYDDAERCVCIFISDYSETDEPFSFIRVKASSSKALTHRDYLGALMGLGVKRHCIGDILVNNSGADIIVLREIADFLLTSFDKAGSADLTVTLISRKELYVPEQLTEIKKDTVSTLRLDSVTASAFSLSRSAACDFISAGRVYVNGRQTVKNDFRIAKGDKIVIRGKGKAVLKEIGGQSKKDRTFITIEKYL